MLPDAAVRSGAAVTIALERSHTRCVFSLAMWPVRCEHERRRGARALRALWHTMASPLLLDTEPSSGPSMDERALREAQRLAGVGSWEWDARADLTTWSAELRRIFGVGPDSPAPKFAVHAGLLEPASWLVLEAAVGRAMTTGETYCVEVEYRRVDGAGGGWIESRGEAIRDADGRIVGLRGTSLEISDRRRAQQAELERLLAEGAQRDRTHLLRAVSEEIRTRLHGVTGFAHLLKRKVADDPQQERWAQEILTASRQIVAHLQKMEVLDGSFFATGSARDLSSSPRSEVRLSQGRLEDRLQTLVELVPCPLLVHAVDGRILCVSKQLTETTGYAPEEIPTRADWARLAYGETDALDIDGHLEKAYAASCMAYGGERWVRTKSGAARRWHLFAAPFASDEAGTPLFVSIGIDVTDVAQATEAAPV